MDITPVIRALEEKREQIDIAIRALRALYEVPEAAVPRLDAPARTYLKPAPAPAGQLTLRKWRGQHRQGVEKASKILGISVAEIERIEIHGGRPTGEALRRMETYEPGRPVEQHQPTMKPPAPRTLGSVPAAAAPQNMGLVGKPGGSL